MRKLAVLIVSLVFSLNVYAFSGSGTLAAAKEKFLQQDAKVEACMLDNLKLFKQNLSKYAVGGMSEADVLMIFGDIEDRNEVDGQMQRLKSAVKGATSLVDFNSAKAELKDSRLVLEVAFLYNTLLPLEEYLALSTLSAKEQEAYEQGTGTLKTPRNVFSLYDWCVITPAYIDHIDPVKGEDTSPINDDVIELFTQ